MQKRNDIIQFSAFLFSLPLGLAAYINSSFLSSFVGVKMSGIIFTAASILSIFAILTAPRIFKKIGGYKFLLLITTINIVCLLCMGMLKNVWLTIAFFIINFSGNLLIGFSLDELLKISSSNKNTGQVRGTYLAVTNLAWIFAQFFSGTFLGGFSFRVVYMTSALIMLFFLSLSAITIKEIPEPKYDRLNSILYIGKFFKNKKLTLAYFINFIIQFFYCWMIIYTPIYLSSYLGFSWKEIGLLFSIMLLPFLFIPILAGKYADKIGERNMLMLGFGIASIATVSLFVVGKPIFWIWALLLFGTRVGISMSESMSDTYFFKHIKPENEEFVGVYRSAPPTAEILGPVVAFLLISILPSFSFIFLILGIFLLTGTFLASRIRRSDI